MITLFDLKQQDKLQFLDTGMKVTYNGGFFSDCDFFTKGKEYNIVFVNATQIKVKSNMSFMNINLVPNGLKAFSIKEEL